VSDELLGLHRDLPTGGRTVFLALRKRSAFSMAREAFGHLGLYNIFFQS